MVKAELKPLLERLGIAPSKRLGQNFLVDDQFRAKILHEADPKPGQTILEIGPGLGAITRGLVASGAKRLLSRFAAASKTEFGSCKMSKDCMAAAQGGCGCGCGHHHH